MDENDTFEPGQHTFTGTIRSWSGNTGELQTDSGLAIIFVAAAPPGPVGSRVTLSTRRYRPRYLVVNTAKA